MASPTLVAVAEADSGATQIASGTGETTPTLTWQTGDVFVVSGVQGGNSVGETFNAPTNTGSGLAWTQQQLHAANNDCTLGVWTAQATASGSGTITLTRNSVNPDNTAVAVYQFRAPSGYAIAVGHSVLATAKTTSPQVAPLPMTSPDSAVVWVAGDWSAGAIETPSPTATSHTTTTPGPSASPVATAISGQYTFYFDDLDDEASTGTLNFGYSGSSAGPFTVAAVEITITPLGGGQTYLPRGMPMGV